MTTPQLDDTRIRAMLSVVLETVDADTTRRGRRARRVLGTAAAACFVVVIGGVGFATLQPTGNGAGGDAGSAAGGRAALEKGAASADSSAPTDPEPQDQREVITTGTVDLAVDDPTSVADRFSDWVERHGGRLDARTQLTDDDQRSASLVVRVPNTQVEAAVDQLRTYGDVGTVDIHRDDVTAQGRDLDARIKALRISIDRLEKILADSTSTDQVVKAESALTQRQEQLERYQAQRRSLSGQVALATLNVEIMPKESSTVEPGGFRGGVEDGWNALVDVVNGVVTLAGVLLPWLGVALVGGLIWVGARRIKRS